MKISKVFTEQSIYYLSLNLPRIEKCLAQLTENQVWIKPNANTNSIGNLILHLCGNITQYAHSSLGNDKDVRNRDQEFYIKGGFTKKELLIFAKDNNFTNKGNIYLYNILFIYTFEHLKHLIINLINIFSINQLIKWLPL